MHQITGGVQLKWGDLQYSYMDSYNNCRGRSVACVLRLCVSEILYPLMVTGRENGRENRSNEMSKSVGSLYFVELACRPTAELLQSELIVKCYVWSYLTPHPEFVALKFASTTILKQKEWAKDINKTGPNV